MSFGALLSRLAEPAPGPFAQHRLVLPLDPDVVAGTPSHVFQACGVERKRSDTIRRAGFGHVIVNRKHALTLERGLSFVALGPGGGPIYGSGLFAPLARRILRP